MISSFGKVPTAQPGPASSCLWDGIKGWQDQEPASYYQLIISLLLPAGDSG